MEVPVTRVVLNGVGKLGRAVIAAAQTKQDEDAADENPVEIVAGVDKHLVDAARQKGLTGEGAPPVIVDGVPVYETLGDVTEQFDVLFDASRAEGLVDILSFALANDLPLVVAATGHSDGQLLRLKRASLKIPILRSTNLSLGVNVTRRLAESAAKMLGDVDVEIVETHHRMKVDAPSGTALTLAQAVRDATGTNRPFVYGRGPEAPGERGNEIAIHALRGGTVVGEHTVSFLLEDEMVEIRHVALSRKVFGFGGLEAVRFVAGAAPGLYDMGDLLD